MRPSFRRCCSRFADVGGAAEDARRSGLAVVIAAHVVGNEAAGLAGARATIGRAADMTVANVEPRALLTGGAARLGEEIAVVVASGIRVADADAGRPAAHIIVAAAGQQHAQDDRGAELHGTSVDERIGSGRKRSRSRARCGSAPLPRPAWVVSTQPTSAAPSALPEPNPSGSAEHGGYGVSSV